MGVGRAGIGAGSPLGFHAEPVAVLRVAVQAHDHIGHALQIELEKAAGVEDGGADGFTLLDFGGEAPVQLGMDHEGRLLVVGDDLFAHHDAAVLVEVHADAVGDVDVVAHIQRAGVRPVPVRQKNDPRLIPGYAVPLVR